MRKRPVGVPVLCIVSLFVLLTLATIQRLARMDSRFFGESTPANRALLHYLIGDYGNSARWYRTALAATPDPGPPSSWTALRSGNDEAAERLARRELAQAPGALHPRLTLAEVALRRGQPTEALEQIRRALELRPDDYDALLVATVAHARSGAWTEALDALKRALREDGAERRYTVFLDVLEVTGDIGTRGNPPLCLLAHLHRYLAMYDPARADSALWFARRAIEAGDRADDAWVTIAAVHDQHGKHRRALDDFARALAVNGTNTAALLGAARVRADRGEIGDEYRLLRRAFQATPDDVFIVDRLHTLLTHKLGDYGQALAVEQRLVSERPADARAWWRLAAVQLHVGQPEAALASLDRATALTDSAEAHEARGHALRALQRHADAAAAYRRSIAIDPARPGPYVGLAILLARERRYAEALAAYERAYHLGATDVEQVVELCSLYYETGRLEQALGCVDQVLVRAPDNVRGRALREHVERAAAARKSA